MMYPTLNDIKQFWAWECYEPLDIAFYVDIGYITKEDYLEIVGEEYK
ncbi:XkdX family protein [Bacillus altitudinis]